MEGVMAVEEVRPETIYLLAQFGRVDLPDRPDPHIEPLRDERAAPSLRSDRVACYAGKGCGRQYKNSHDSVSIQTSRKDTRLTPQRVSAVRKRSFLRTFNSLHLSDVEK